MLVFTAVKPFDAVFWYGFSRIICGRLNVTRSVQKPVQSRVANRSPEPTFAVGAVCCLGLIPCRGHGQDHARRRRFLKGFRARRREFRWHGRLEVFGICADRSRPTNTEFVLSTDTLKLFRRTTLDTSKGFAELFSFVLFCRAPHGFGVPWKPAVPLQRPHGRPGMKRPMVTKSSSAEQATDLLKSAPKPAEVLELYLPKLVPSSWSGSLSEIVRKNALFLEELRSFANADLKEAIDQGRRQLEEQATELEWLDRDRDRGFERFE